MKTQHYSENALLAMLKTLRLPYFATNHKEVATSSSKKGLTYGQYLYHLAEQEISNRTIKRRERFLKSSKLPVLKTLDSLDLKILGGKIRKQLPELCSGEFIKRNENILIFGLPGLGKTHIASAIGHELIKQDYRVLFQQTGFLVQSLLAARQSLTLERALKKLDKFDLIILDDLGYVQQDRDEMEVLFTFLGERYERRSLIITSNLVFSQWDKIFKDPMTTAAAIDRVVHHSIILELNGKSYRATEAEGRIKLINIEKGKD